jgi:hypothetical protein
MTDVEMGRGLVEEKHPRLLCEPPGQGGQLALAGGERAQLTSSQRLDARAVQSAPYRGAVLFRERAERTAVRVPSERHPVLHGQRTRPLVLGRHERDRARQRVARPGLERTVLEEHGAARGGQQAGQGAHQGRFARGVRAHQGEGLARRERERDAVQDVGPPTPDVDVARLEHGGHERPSVARSASRK